MNKLRQLFIILLFFLGILPAYHRTMAGEKESFVTLVNPVRSKEHWVDPQSLEKHIGFILSKKIPSTWLVQYSVLIDKENQELLKTLPPDQEIGLFLEVDERWATDSFVPYLLGSGDWARPDKVFLSGYDPSERKRLIDMFFSQYFAIFEKYPKSVGIWYIDSLSLNYMRDKYGIEAVLDCSDQYRTDKYGLWGKPWGVAYIPSKYNSLLPASPGLDENGLVKIQWAQRDPVLGYGLEVADSTYSTQANDYQSSHKLDINYFKHLADLYLFTENPVNQLTIGLEVGQEGVAYGPEFSRQIDLLISYQKDKKLIFTTMSGFSKAISGQKIDIFNHSFIEGTHFADESKKAYWYSTPYYRIGLLLEKGVLRIRDLRKYENKIFGDFFKKDQKEILEKYLPSCVDELNDKNSLVLEENIKNIETKRVNNKIEMLITFKNGSTKKLHLGNESIVYDHRQIINLIKNKSQFERLRIILADFLMAATERMPHLFIGGIRFSEIDGVKYLGLMIDAEKIMGINSKPPFIGLFRFPFQTLVRFKGISLPFYISLNDFVLNPEHCTIKL